MRRSEWTWIASIAGMVAGSLLPVSVVIMGWIIELMVSAVSGSIPGAVAVGPFVFSTDWLQAGNSALRVGLGLVLLLGLVVLMKYLALTIGEIAVRNAAADFETQVQKLLFTKSSSQATEVGLSVQRSVLNEIQTECLPQVRDAIEAWYTAWPRFLVRALILLAIALLIHPWLTAAMGGGLLILWLYYAYLQSSINLQRQAQRERWSQSRDRMMYLRDTAPLLATIHNTEATDEEFQSQVQIYRSAGVGSNHAGVYTAPSFRLLCIVMAIAMMALVMIRVLDRQSSIGLGGAATLGVSVFMAAVSVFHGYAAWARRRAAEGRLQKITSYLGQSDPAESPHRRIAPASITRDMVFDHVMLRESHGAKLLEDVSVVLKRGQLTALVGSDPLQTHALAELCLGFGKPTSGRVLIDHTDATDISRSSLQKLALWVAPNGPLFNGTIAENLWVKGQPDATIDLMEAARKSQVADVIMNLPEGLQTLVSPSEERLDRDSRFRIGIARGFVKKPSVVVAEEPGPTLTAIDSESTHALLQLKNEGFIVVVLASRLATLRAADQIVLIHEHRVEDIGTHSELLERNERYRHMNYLRFSRVGIG
jgi:ABC-type multidrug transport system fused ATPase/permease subunit